VSHNCEPCGRQVFCCDNAWKRLHAATQSHREYSQQMGYHCPASTMYFFNKASWKAHCDKLHSDDVEYYCIDCKQDFPSQCALDTHPKKDAVHRKRSSGAQCEVCGKSFISIGDLEAHKSSHAHAQNMRIATIKCWAFPRCSQKFVDNGAMLAHLESGGCVSEINRHKIGNVIRNHDTNNVILKAQYSAPQGRRIPDTPGGAAGSASSNWHPGSWMDYDAVETYELDSEDENAVEICEFGSDYEDLVQICELGSDDEDVVQICELDSDDEPIISTPPRSPAGSRRASIRTDTIAAPMESLSEVCTSNVPEVSTLPGPTSGQAAPRFSNRPIPSAASSGEPTCDSSGVSMAITVPARQCTPTDAGFASPVPSVSGHATPQLSGSSTPSTDSSPSTSELDAAIRLRGVVCNTCHKTFPSRKSLKNHLSGLAHAARIFHSPTAMFRMLQHGKLEPRKDFKSLSGLVMHLESGLYGEGAERVNIAMAYVQEKLKREVAELKLKREEAELRFKRGEAGLKLLMPSPDRM